MRLAGGGLITGVIPQGVWLRAMIRAATGITASEIALAALCFLCSSAGIALLLLGPELWKPVPVSDRWIAYRTSDAP